MNLTPEELDYYNKYDKKLSASDPRFNGCVQISFEDGSNMYFNYAFYIFVKKKKRLIVFTEHCGWHVIDYNEGIHFEYLARACPTHKFMKDYQALQTKRWLK